MNKNKPGEIPDRFTEGKSSPQEARNIMNHLLETELAGEEWEEWQKMEAVELDSETSQAMVQEITAMKKPEQPLRRIILPLLKVAAVLLFFVGALQVVRWYFSPVKENGEKEMAGRMVNQEELVNPSATAVARFTLADGSAVVLQPGARVCFQKDSLVNGTKRDIYIKGSAFFEVKKRAGRPFSVYGVTLSVTALGTSFDVLEKNGENKVRLHTGKVVVNSIPISGKTAFAASIYLLPGDEVATNGQKKLFRVPSERQATIAVAPAVNAKKNRKVAFEFDNTPLSEVFTQLEKKFKVHIVYDGNALAHVFFSGEVLETDALPSILKIICGMKSLTVRDSASTFFIQN